MTNDPNTGLPSVPEEGMFWRVVGENWWNSSPEIHLRKRIGPFSVKVEWTCTRLDSRELISDANFVLRKYREERGNRNLIGDYPPKKLSIDE